MRFISKYGRYTAQVLPLIQEAYATGLVRVVQESVFANFEPTGLLPHEREMALARWSFNGLYQEMDEATTVDPDYRIGVFDSKIAQQQKGWSDETREIVEQALLQVEAQDDLVFCVRSLIPPPWPNYDSFAGTPAALVRKLVEDGHDLDAALTYEREHQDRPKVIDEIEKAISTGSIEIGSEEEVIG